MERTRPVRDELLARLYDDFIRIVFLGGGGHCTRKWSQVVEVAWWTLESSGCAPKRVPGPSRTGRDPSESQARELAD